MICAWNNRTVLFYITYIKRIWLDKEGLSENFFSCLASNKNFECGRYITLNKKDQPKQTRNSKNKLSKISATHPKGTHRKMSKIEKILNLYRKGKNLRWLNGEMR